MNRSLRDVAASVDGRIAAVLRDYRCQYTRDAEDDGLPLIDVLSPGATVAEGEKELRLLADALAAAVADELTAALAEPSLSTALLAVLRRIADDPRSHNEPGTENGRYPAWEFGEWARTALAEPTPAAPDVCMCDPVTREDWEACGEPTESQDGTCNICGKPNKAKG